MILVFLVETMIIIGLIQWYRKSAFVLSFTAEKISYRKKHRDEEIDFSYQELYKVEYFHGTGNSIGANVFHFKQGNMHFKYVADLVDYGEEFVKFIKFLKSQNPNFKTHVRPKGSTMHMRLRQEILGTEY